MPTKRSRVVVEESVEQQPGSGQNAESFAADFTAPRHMKTDL